MHNGPICQEQPRNKVQCSLILFHTPPAFPPFVIKLNLWIFISTPATQESAITLICPDKATSSLPFQQSLLILKLSPACSATSRIFHIPPHYEDHMVTMHVSLVNANLNTLNVSIPIFIFGNTLVAPGLQHTCRYWLTYLRFLLHSSIST